MNHSHILGAILAGFLSMATVLGDSLPSTQPSIQPTLERQESPAQRDARMKWWREARFGMFIHWGVYSVPAGVYKDKEVPSIGEWIMNHAKIPVAEYAQYTERFNPVGFDADHWVRTAKAAGMKYIVITAKHHDGFAMFHTKVDGYNITDATPFDRDPLAELAESCQAAGIKLGFYYSQCQDWHHPGGYAVGGHWDKAQDGDFDAYLKNVAVPQVKELLTNYGPIAVLWFDTPGKLMTPDRAAEFLPLLDLQPQIIVNNRLGGGFKGDTENPEQHIPPNGYPGEDWETCMTINDTWGYKSNDQNFKSTDTLVRNLVDIASKGGNYLLNVGPNSDGIIPQPEVDRLAALGDWLKINGDSIYASGPTPFGSEAGQYDPKKKDKHGKPIWVTSWDWRCTTKPGKLFIHLFKWPGHTFTLNGVTGSITRAYMLADSPQSDIPFKQNGNRLQVDLPPFAPDPIDSVLVLELPEHN